MPEDAYIVIRDIDGSSNPLKAVLDEGQNGVEYGIIPGGAGKAEEHEFTFEGSMGETICRHPRQCPDYYFTQFETSDGTLRLPPAVTNVSSLDIAYTPITMWEDFDSDGDRAFYIQYRDTTATPDIISKKYRVTDDTLVDTETSTDQGGAAQETAPRMGRVASFEGDTIVPFGDESGSNHIRSVSTVGDISAATADTWTEGDHFSSSHAVIEEDGVAKFIKIDGHEFKTASTTPITDANNSGAFNVGDSGSPGYWSVELGGFVYVSKAENLYELDPTSARPLLDMRAERKNKVFQTYDDFDGHMATTVGAAVLYPHRSGFWRYRSGRSLNLSIDNIPGYREVANVSDAPIGLRHYATDAVGQWVYAIYKPTGFSNQGNCNIMSAFYQPGAARELTWRTLITRTEDLIGLKIDSDKRLWFVQNPNDPAVSNDTATVLGGGSNANGTGTSLQWSHTVSSGTQRVLKVGISNSVSSAPVAAPSSVTFGAQSMAFAGSTTNSTLNCSLWLLTAPLVSTANITAVFAKSQSGITGGAVNFDGIDQSEPIRGATGFSATGNDTTPKVTVTSATNDLVIDVICVNAVPSVTGDETEQWDVDSGSTISGAGSTMAGASSVEPSWVLGASQPWAQRAVSLRPGGLGSADADLNYIQLSSNGSPRTTLGRDRGAASTTYEHYVGEVQFDRRVQARYMRVETENFDSTTSLQMQINRDGALSDSIGSAITSDDFHQIDFTVGTTDLLRRARVRFTLDTNGSYSPTVSDPRILRAVLGIRSPDTYKAIMRTGNSINSARTERKILRQRKGAGTVTMTESWSGTQFRADITAIRDLDARREPNGQLMYRTEITFERHDVEV
jgi:hypothetical protein